MEGGHRACSMRARSRSPLDRARSPVTGSSAAGSRTWTWSDDASVAPNGASLRRNDAWRAMTVLRESRNVPSGGRVVHPERRLVAMAPRNVPWERRNVRCRRRNVSSPRRVVRSRARIVAGTARVVRSRRRNVHRSSSVVDQARRLVLRRPRNVFPSRRKLDAIGPAPTVGGKNDTPFENSQAGFRGDPACTGREGRKARHRRGVRALVWR